MDQEVKKTNHRSIKTWSMRIQCGTGIFYLGLTGANKMCFFGPKDENAIWIRHPLPAHQA